MDSEISDQIPEFESFPPGLHELTWIGRVKKIPGRDTPMVELQMTPLEPTSEGSSLPTIVLASVTHWPEFRLGTAWKDGQRQPGAQGAFTVESFDLEIAPETQQLVTAYHKRPHGFLIPPFHHSIVRELGNTRLLLLSASAQDAVDVDVVIPCGELFRAYYGTSSRLAYYILTGGFIYEGNNRIYDPSRSWLRNGVAFVQISSRMRNSDAHQIARMAFDPVAHDNTLAIVRDSIAASNADQPYTLAVQPPFHGVTHLRVAGIPIQTKRFVDGKLEEWSRFLVMRILHCTGPMPFNEVLFERDNPGGYGQERQPGSRRLPTQTVRDRQKSDDPTAKIREDADPNDLDSPIIFIDYETPPVYDTVPVTRVARDDAGEQRSRVEHSTADPATSFSGGAGSHNGTHTSAQFEIINAGEGDERMPGSLAYFRAAIEGVQKVAEKLEVTIACDLAIVPLRWTKDAGPRTGWANIREGERSRPRRLIVASVAFMDHAFFLMEIERRGGEKLATLGLFSASGMPLPHGVLERVKLVIVKNRGHLDNDDRWSEHQLNSVERLSIHHHQSNVPAEIYAARILTRLAASAGIELPKAPTKRKKTKPMEPPAARAGGGGQEIAS